MQYKVVNYDDEDFFQSVPWAEFSKTSERVEYFDILLGEDQFKEVIEFRVILDFSIDTI